MVIQPTLQKDSDTDTVTIVSPPEWAGREVVRVEGWPCAQPIGTRSICGLIRGHRGPHWECSIELVEESGPWAVVALGS